MWEAGGGDLFAEGADGAVRPSEENARSVTSGLTSEDLEQDRTLRPKTLDEYLGQARVRENLRVLIQAAKDRHEPLDHGSKS